MLNHRFISQQNKRDGEAKTALFGTDGCARAGSKSIPGMRGSMRGWTRAARWSCAAFRQLREDEEPRAAAAASAAVPRTRDSASNPRFRLEPAIPPRTRSARAPLRAEGTAAAPRPPRHWPRPPSLTRPAGPRQPGTPDGAGAARPRSHRGTAAPACPGRLRAPLRPHGAPRPGRAARGNGAAAAAPPEPPVSPPGARCPVPSARCRSRPAARSRFRRQRLRRPPRAAPLCPRPGLQMAPAGDAAAPAPGGTERHRAVPGGSGRHRAAPGGTERPEAPAAAAEPRALLAAGLAAGPVPPQSQRPARPTGVREPPLTGGVLRAAAAEPGGAGGGCGIPGSASGLAVPAGDAPLLPQPRALRARTGEKQKILLSNPGRALKIFMRPILLL